MKKILLTFLFVYLISLLLLYPKESISYAREGLLIWFQTMLPTLMPFMILSTLMISLHLTDFLGAKKYCIVMGFLCGFPMGAKVVKDLYLKENLSKQEAADLLGFCNNLGPVFLLNFALPTLGIKNPFWCLFGFYTIPFCYGMVILFLHSHRNLNRSHLQNNQASKPKISIRPESEKTSQLLYHIDDAIQCAISSITLLGGYMIFFNLLNIIPHAVQNMDIFRLRNIHLLPPLRAFIEISGGLASYAKPSLWILCLIPMGGLSCLAQVYSVIKDTDLSYGTYLKHKFLQTLFTILYFTALSFTGLFSF